MEPIFKVEESLRQIIQDNFAPHPFSTIKKEDDLPLIFSRFVALSQCTPYILAGAIHRLFDKRVKAQIPINEQDEISTLALSFLTWDETGGNLSLRENGEQNLPKILSPVGYHSRILVQDLSKALGTAISPIQEPFTKAYFEAVVDDLSNPNPIARCASIIAFEMHAEQIIIALWDVLIKLYPHIAPKDLKYFDLHVGANNPAEEYHIAMTKEMTNLLTLGHDSDSLFNFFHQSYKLNYNWAKHAAES